MSLYDWLQAGGGAALLLMTLVQIAPIKINPWSAVARGIGKTMNKDMMDISTHSLTRRLTTCKDRLLRFRVFQLTASQGG